MNNKIILQLLVAILLISLLPASAFAENTSEKELVYLGGDRLSVHNRGEIYDANLNCNL